jgi:uncharacterized membrane-anchored protein
MKQLIALTLAALVTISVRANDEDSLAKKLEQYTKFIDSVSAAMKYETGQIKLSNGIAQLNVPQGFKFLNAEQARYVLSDLWGNPPDNDVVGMIFPETGGPFADSNYAFVVSWQQMGYVKDEDAHKIDYDDMLKDLQKGEAEENKERQKMGYSTIHMVGWAAKPFYDKTNKVLHWAKELEFDGSEEHTLNYDVRILGRKGVLSLNAVAGMAELPLVKKDIDKVLHIATFTEGNKYSDFDSKIDDVAAWTIGGLVAGKVLAKVGFLAVILKFGKFILIGIAAIGAFIFKFFKKKKQDQYHQAPIDGQSNV